MFDKLADRDYGRLGFTVVAKANKAATQMIFYSFFHFSLLISFDLP